MKQLFTFLLVAISSILLAQAPQSIPYQAIVRNTDGSVMASTSITMTFKIHDVSATGTIVYEEIHTTTSNAQGIVAMNVGEGTPVTGNFNNIKWGNGAKFLHVLMNVSSGIADLGTQQMMSVPYALYSSDVYSRVSKEGDTLFVGSKFYIIPGISVSNWPVVISGCTHDLACNFNPNATSYDGSCLYQCGRCDDSNPGTVNDHVIMDNEVCHCQGIEYTQLFSQGNGVTDIDSNVYQSIIINGQEWMQGNLAVSHYSNGDDIETGLTSSQWINTTNGAYAIYNDDIANNATYGKLYNWYAAVDTRNICPTGWHIPTSDEFTLLVNFLGGENIAGEKMKSNLEIDGIGYDYLLGWINACDSDIWHSNSSGFTALGGGSRWNGTYDLMNSMGFWWTSSLLNDFELSLWVDISSNGALFGGQERNDGLSIRCIKD